jgi:putative Holliday junction resolvase
MSRLLGLDYGQKRIGLALSDPTRTIASPLTTLTRRVGKRPPWPEIGRIVGENHVVAAVIGLPLDLSGEEGEWAAEVRRFGDEFTRRLELPVHWIDERLSSVRAERAVRSMGLKRADREDKSRVDAAAAAIILQAFLDRASRQRNEEAAR